MPELFGIENGRLPWHGLFVVPKWPIGVVLLPMSEVSGDCWIVGMLVVAVAVAVAASASASAAAAAAAAPPPLRQPNVDFPIPMLVIMTWKKDSYSSLNDDFELW